MLATPLHARSLGPSTLVLLAILAPAVAAQRATAPGGPEQWVSEAESLLDERPEAALTLLSRHFAELERAPAALRLRAQVTRCRAAVDTETDSVLAYARTGLALAERAGDARAVVALRTCRGYGLHEVGELQPALADYDFAIAEAQRLRAPRLLANARVYRGELHYYRGDFDHALADMAAAYRQFVELQVQTKEVYTLTAIANVYADGRVGQYDRALEYYRQVLAVYRARGNQRLIAETYFNLGSTLERKGSLNQALAEYRRALAIDIQRGDAEETAVDRRALGVVLYKLNRPAEALRVLDLALAHFDQAHDAESAAAAHLSRGVALRMLGRPADALRDLEVARERFEGSENRRFLEKVQEERAFAFAAAGDWANAYSARTSQLALQRQLSDEAREQQTSRLQVSFDVEKKESENAALLRENALRRQTQAAGDRVRRLQIAVLLLSAVVIVALALLIARQLRSSRLLRVMAHTDELTRVPNRRSLLALGEEQARAAAAGGPGFGVLALDVDHFKHINDQWGHDAGDEVLRTVAAVVRGSLRTGDQLGRTGGEEFIAVLPGASLAPTMEVAQRLRTAVEQAAFDGYPRLAVTVSVGAAVWDGADGSFNGTCRRADASLYRAKEAGRNRVEG